MKNGVPWRVRKAQRLAAKKSPVRKQGPIPANHNPHAPRGITPWDVPRLYDNNPLVCIIGGGPSLKTDEGKAALECTREHNCIVVNQSYEIAPWAHVLHFADCAWWEWNGKDVLKVWPEEKLIVTATSDVLTVNHPRIKRMWRDRNKFTTDRQKVHGWDGGLQAINLAYHMGAKRIVLFGIDMRAGPNGETQWHGKHKRKTATKNYKEKFIPTYLQAIPKLRELGVEVVRATDGADIGVPLLPLDECLKLPENMVGQRGVAQENSPA